MSFSPAARRRLLGLASALIVLALDQASKIWAIGLLGGPEHPVIALTPFLALTLSWNRGIAYTMLRSDGDLGRYALVGVALVAVIFLTVWLWRAHRPAAAAGFGCLIGGALGNALDRLVHGAVADFLYFHTPFSLGPLSNYVFNLADAGIVAGVALLLYDSLATPESAKARKA
ncbi:signal peptidase II [Rhodoblastus sp.]|uniref:signal peptidase II n=1 Tax=Rhodoblastus sp. TaxID=1962975 RepID=UPI003F9E7BD9